MATNEDEQAEEEEIPIRRGLHQDKVTWMRDTTVFDKNNRLSLIIFTCRR